MKKVFCILFCLVYTSALYAQRYKIDPGHTAVTSKVLRFGVVKVVGRFTTVSGTISFNANSPTTTTAEISVKTDSYTANNAGGEEAVKGPGFLDSNTFPEMNLIVKNLVRIDNHFMVAAMLTIHGVTKDVSFPVTINGPLLDLPTGKQSIGISGVFTINRQDYGIKMSRKLPSGAEVVGNEVEIEINALAIAE